MDTPGNVRDWVRAGRQDFYCVVPSDNFRTTFVLHDNKQSPWEIQRGKWWRHH
jgi:hypothetical protein